MIKQLSPITKIILPVFFITLAISSIYPHLFEPAQVTSYILTDFVYLFSTYTILELSTKLSMKKRLTYIVILTLLLSGIHLSGVGSYFLIGVVLPISFVISVIIIEHRKDNLRSKIFKSLYYFGLIAFLQFMAIQIRSLDLDRYQLIQVSPIHIDAFLIALLLLGGDLYGFKFFTDIKVRNITREDSEHMREVQERVDKNNLIGRVFIYSSYYFIQILQILIVLSTSLLIGNFAGGVILLISFISSGFIIKNRFHYDAFIICTGVSVLAYFMVMMALPFLEYSFVIYIIAGLLLVCMLNRIKVYIDSNKDKIKKLKDEIAKFKEENEIKIVKYVDKSEVIRIGKMKRLTELEIELLVKKYSENMQYTQLEAKYCNQMSLSTLKRYIKNAKNKIEN